MAQNLNIQGSAHAEAVLSDMLSTIQSQSMWNFMHQTDANFGTSTRMALTKVETALQQLIKEVHSAE